VRADSINGRVVARALTASLHLRNRLVISVVPPLAPWEGLGQRWPVSRCAAWRQRIETRIETVDATFRDSLRWSPPKRSFLERESGLRRTSKERGRIGPWIFGRLRCCLRPGWGPLGFETVTRRRASGNMLPAIVCEADLYHLPSVTGLRPQTHDRESGCSLIRSGQRGMPLPPRHFSPCAGGESTVSPAAVTRADHLSSVTASRRERRVGGPDRRSPEHAGAEPAARGRSAFCVAARPGCCCRERSRRIPAVGRYRFVY
jgi:hypothetical protein